MRQPVIVGFGVEGRSIASFLTRSGSTGEPIVLDQKDGADYLELLHDPGAAERYRVVKSAGVPGRVIPIDYTTATNLAMAAARRAGNPIVGITGSKGKSTTSRLTRDILRSNGFDAVLCGNSWRPMLDYLPSDPGTVFVVELSSYQLADIDRSPDISVVLNLYQDHMDYHGSLQAYHAAKNRILIENNPSHQFIYDGNSSKLDEWATAFRGMSHAIRHNSSPLNLTNSRLFGTHNLYNAQVAARIGELFHLSPATIQPAIDGFEPLPHRLQLIGSVDDISYIDDSNAISPESAVAGIDAINTKLRVSAAILGGGDRGYNFTYLAHALAERGLSVLVLMAESGLAIAGALSRVRSYEPLTLQTSDFREAIAFVQTHAPAGTAAVLSAASPSMPRWQSFEAKSAEFRFALDEYCHQAGLQQLKDQSSRDV